MGIDGRLGLENYVTSSYIHIANIYYVCLFDCYVSLFVCLFVILAMLYWEPLTT